VLWVLFAHALNLFDCVVLYANFLQGKLYLYEAPQPGAKLAATESVWADRRVIRVPPDKIGGAEHVIALCPGVCCSVWLHIRSWPSQQRPALYERLRVACQLIPIRYPCLPYHVSCFLSSAESLDLSRLAENSSSLVLRLDSEEQADLWYRHLQQAQQAMRELAGEGRAQLLPDWEEASSTVSGAEAEETSAGLAASQVLLTACL
jgi:hypothetical protein